MGKLNEAVVLTAVLCAIDSSGVCSFSPDRILKSKLHPKLFAILLYRLIIEYNFAEFYAYSKDQYVLSLYASHNLPMFHSCGVVAHSSCPINHSE